MSRRVRYLTSARQNLVEILRYVSREAGSAATGQKLVSAIRARIGRIASLPGTLGQPRPELFADARSIAQGNYLIFFRYSGENELEVVAVLEGHRDLAPIFGQTSGERDAE